MSGTTLIRTSLPDGAGTGIHLPQSRTRDDQQ